MCLVRVTVVTEGEARQRYLWRLSIDLKVMLCNDVNCADDNESIESPDTGAISAGTPRWGWMAVVEANAAKRARFRQPRTGPSEVL